jgi:hypothetical protein
MKNAMKNAMLGFKEKVRFILFSVCSVKVSSLASFAGSLKWGVTSCIENWLSSYFYKGTKCMRRPGPFDCRSVAVAAQT